MKTYLLIAAAMFLSGCSLFYDAPRIDADYGQAQAQAWDSQMAVTDYRYAESTPEGLGGIPSEQVMKVYNQSFGKKSKIEDIFSLGVTGRR